MAGTITETMARWAADLHYDDVAESALHEARRYLLESKQTVDSVAALLGYYDAAAFRKAFRRQHGMTPSAYRQRHRGG